MRSLQPPISPASNRRRGHRHWRYRRAFTLIELVACIAIMAILAAAAALSLRGHRAEATMPAAVQIVRFADEQARQRALRSDAPVELRLAPARPDTLVLGSGPASSEFQLPDGFRVARARIAGQGRETDEISVRFSPRGWAPAYALQITDGARSQWLAFTGVIGDPQTPDDDQTLEHILPGTGADTR
jgi:prepilin-type N-terminal cleavage/methylation domain-containing protein